jgi:hypothetical protein
VCACCSIEFPSIEAVEVREGHVCPRCTSVLLPARAAVLVVGYLLAWSFVDCLVTFVDYALLNAARGDVPSFGVQLVLGLTGTLVYAGGLAFAVHHATNPRRPRTGRLSPRAYLGVIMLSFAALGASWAAVSLRTAMSRLVSDAPVAKMTEWVTTNAKVGTVTWVVGLLLRGAVFLYALWRWQSLAARSVTATTPSQSSSPTR